MYRGLYESVLKNGPVSTIILRTDDKKLNEKRMEVNLHLNELSKEKNMFLTDNSRKIKAQHLNKGKLHLTKYSSRVLSNNEVIQTLMLKRVILKMISLPKNSMSTT